MTGAAPRVQLLQQKRLILWRAQKMTFWVLYDFAGHLIVLNMATLAAVLLPAWGAAAVLPAWNGLPILLAALITSVAVAGHACLIAALVSNEEFSYGLVWRGIRLFGFSALLTATVYAIAAGIIAVGVWFYAVHLASTWPLYGMFLAALCCGAGVLLALSSIYVVPALVHQRGSVPRALRVSFALVGRHPVLTPGLLALAAVYAVALLTPPGLLLFSILPLVVLGCSAYELLARAYAADAALAAGDAVPDEALDAYDPFLNRGFSDLLRPWKV